ncbi:hypothetical protein [Streptomyces zingiberis]|uniref:NERD domain-containing protein n=1 Tax=Streptomyces zingiberis TaxID=2053010 RepID=A0ABX1C1W3_9ACTN|nr:hypothetical protein [Streptomyces zingiberis]NJQ03885.1 hypothetical protein [Streptomyces zingiberis]
MLRAAEDMGEAAAQNHAIPERFPGATLEFDGPGGANRFDQIWRRPDGGFVVVETKGSLTAQLGTCWGHGVCQRVMQGTHTHFTTIVDQMKSCAHKFPEEASLAQQLELAILDGKVDYVLVKADVADGKYAGYEVKRLRSTALRSAPGGSERAAS